MEKKSLGRGLEDIADIFISQKYDHPGRDDDLGTGNHENAPKDCTNSCEITEHITIYKKMGYLNTEDVQKRIVNSLFQHLGQNYELKKIELAKVSKVSRPGMKNVIEENVLIYIKEEVKNGN